MLHSLDLFSNGDAFSDPFLRFAVLPLPVELHDPLLEPIRLNQPTALGDIQLAQSLDIGQGPSRIGHLPVVLAQRIGPQFQHLGSGLLGRFPILTTLIQLGQELERPDRILAILVQHLALDLQLGLGSLDSLGQLSLRLELRGLLAELVTLLEPVLLLSGQWRRWFGAGRSLAKGLRHAGRDDGHA
jgi:hypothetical protein